MLPFMACLVCLGLGLGLIEVQRCGEEDGRATKCCRGWGFFRTLIANTKRQSSIMPGSSRCVEKIPSPQKKSLITVFFQYIPPLPDSDRFFVDTQQCP